MQNPPMLRDARRSVMLAAVAVCVAVGSCGEAVAQTSKMLEFGPDSMEIWPPVRAAAPPPSRYVEPDIARDPPWVLATAWELRLPQPPDERASALERQVLRKVAVGTDAAALDRVRYWDAGPPAQRWEEMLASSIARAEWGEEDARRGRELLAVALHDATVAAWDSKRAYRRPHPSEMDARLVPEVAIAPGPSYPCEHAVVAGVASAILGHLFPGDGPGLIAAAHEAAWSRVAASAAYPSDAEAGLALGRAVAARVIDFARADPRGFQAVASHAMPRPERRQRERADANVGAVAREETVRPTIAEDSAAQSLR